MKDIQELHKDKYEHISLPWYVLGAFLRRQMGIISWNNTQ